MNKASKHFKEEKRYLLCEITKGEKNTNYLHLSFKSKKDNLFAYGILIEINLP